MMSAVPDRGPAPRGRAAAKAPVKDGEGVIVQTQQGDVQPAGAEGSEVVSPQYFPYREDVCLVGRLIG
jgi:hypothetical protein